MTAVKTVGTLRSEIVDHRRWYPSNALGTAEAAVTALERLVAAAPSEVFGLLDELRGDGEVTQ